MQIRSNQIAKYAIVAIVFLLITSSLHAQNFSTLPEKERNEKLIELAKLIFKNPKFKGYYREFGEPTIRTTTLHLDIVNKNPKCWEYGKDLGSLTYVVNFPYDKSKEKMSWYDFAAEVYISDKQGKAYFIQFGNGMGCYIWDENPKLDLSK